MKHAFLMLVAVVTLALVSAGCVVRTGPAHRRGHGAHPHSHRHDHCHHRGKKHKRVCHSHPHGPGHH